MGFHSFIEAAKVLQNNANNQRIINAEFFSRILSINKVLPDYFDTEWVMYNIVLVTVLLYVSHLVSLAYRCNRAHYRQLNRIYIEKKWLDSRIELLNRKRAAMSLITEQLKQEICREMFAFNIIEKCEKQSLEKLESKKLEDINYASQCLSKLEYNNASLQSKILSVKASISSECSDYPSSSNATSTSLRNVSYIPIDSVSNSQINTTCCNLDSLVSLNDIFLGDSIDNMTSTPNRYITDGNNLLNYPDLVNINHESMSENLNIDMNNGSDFDNNNSEEEEEEELSEEDFSLSSTSMLAVSFDTNITASMLILKLEDFAIRHGACHKQCIISIARALLDNSGVLDPNNMAVIDEGVRRLEYLLGRFSKLVTYYTETDDDKKFLKSYLMSIINQGTIDEKLADLTLREFFRHGLLI